MGKVSKGDDGYEAGTNLTPQNGTRRGGFTRFLDEAIMPPEVANALLAVGANEAAKKTFLEDFLESGEEEDGGLSAFEFEPMVSKFGESPSAAKKRIAHLNHVRKIETFCANARHVLENGGKLGGIDTSVLLTMKSEVTKTSVYVQPQHPDPQQATASAPKLGLAAFDGSIKDLRAQFPRMTVKWHGQFKREAVSGEFSWRMRTLRVSMTKNDTSREHFVARALREAEAYFRAQKPLIEKEDREMIANSGEILARAEKAFE